MEFNPLNAELKLICHLLAYLGAHHIFHVSGLRVTFVEIYSWFDDTHAHASNNAMSGE
jgi:hypothetical protein